MGIYQPYISVIASLLLIYIIRAILVTPKKPFHIFATAIKYIAFIIISALVYYGVTLLILKIKHLSFNAYASNGISNSFRLFQNLICSYKIFFDIFLHHFDAIFGTDVSQFFIVIAMACAVICAFLKILRIEGKHFSTLLLFGLCLVLFPISINLIFSITGNEYAHALMMCGTYCIYVFIFVLTDSCFDDRLFSIVPIQDIITICLLIVGLVNSFISNKSFMKQAMDYENIYSFFNISMAQVSQIEGFDENTKIAFVGWYQMPEYVDNFGKNVLYGSQELGNAYSRNDFLKYYLGIDVPLAEADELFSLEDDPRLQEMPRYPYHGYVKKIDNYIVVRF